MGDMTRGFTYVDEAGDKLTAELYTYVQQDGAADGDKANDYIMVQTQRGRSVYLPLRIARELASWLIEHSPDDWDSGWFAPLPPASSTEKVSEPLMQFAGKDQTVTAWHPRFGECDNCGRRVREADDGYCYDVESSPYCRGTGVLHKRKANGVDIVTVP